MSTTRRNFLRGGALAIVALPTLRSPAARKIETRPANTRLSDGRIKFDCILVDARRAQALAFGDEARALGGRIHAISGDIADPCYGELRRRWRIAPVPVAGITDFRALFLLQAMASEAGMRAVLRIHHRSHAASMVHEAFGSKTCRAAAAEHLSRAGIHWSSAAARLLLALSASDLRGPEDASNPGDAGNPHSLDSRVLVTWAIA